MKKAFRAWLHLSILFVLVLSGCGNNASSPRLTGTIELNNGSNVMIDRFYLVSIEEASYGSDNVTDFVYPGESRSFVNITPGNYDAKIGVNSTDSDYFAYVYDIPITAGNTIFLKVDNSSFTGSLEIINNKIAAKISGVYFVPSNASAWGDNQISSVIGPSEALHLYDVEPGLYNVKVVWDDGSESIHNDVRLESLAMTALNVG